MAVDAYRQKEGGMQVLAGLDLYQNKRILIEKGEGKTKYTFSDFLMPFPRFHRISVLRSTSRRVGLLYVSGALRSVAENAYVVLPRPY